jgi:hypothetical protein
MYFGAQEPHGCYRRIGSVLKGSAVRAVAREARVVSLRSTPRASRRYLAKDRGNNVQEPPSLACPIPKDWRAMVAERKGVHSLGEPERSDVRRHRQ